MIPPRSSYDAQLAYLRAAERYLRELGKIEEADAVQAAVGRFTVEFAETLAPNGATIEMSP
ncbi:hypothetical protein [Cupriavidus agavae]|uniref:Uncharacterized protein n=1 Tax=Cupriavidus agavae TaxID=1001822 RepID=A0A4V2FG50_9BURK|nr:hypothetical protein [Cupriavidus agavae]RZT35549.1 hypothetical protein EV147_4010 [Cupriavidus agavae]